MRIRIRDITEEEKARYGQNVFDHFLADRRAVVFMDDEGHSGVLFMSQRDIDTLGERYIEENSRLEKRNYNGEDAWVPKVSWSKYKNNQGRYNRLIIDVEFVESVEDGEKEIWRRLDGNGYVMRWLYRVPSFVVWMTCFKDESRWEMGERFRQNIIFKNGNQTEMVRYDDRSEAAVYEDTYNPNFREG